MRDTIKHNTVHIYIYLWQQMCVSDEEGVHFYTDVSVVVMQ